MSAGRPEQPVDPSAGPVQQFAWELRQLREKAGRPTYRRLAKQAHYSVTTLADAAKGYRLPSLDVTLAFVAACGGDTAEWEQRWRTLSAELAPVQPVSSGESEDPPYAGLAAFQPETAARFFGRERLVDDLVARLASRRFLTVVGASGSGKSSLLRAGLMPALQAAGTWRPVLLTPGASPVLECAIGLATQLGLDPGPLVTGLAEDPSNLGLAVRQALADLPPEAEVVLVVDQFEEVFTLCEDDRERDRFIAALLTAARHGGSRTRVVLGLRADCYARCAEHPELVAALQDAELLVGPMTTEELTRAITQPAARSGLIVEKALTTAVLADVAGQPGYLPLVSHALLETWRRRRGNALTLAGYVATGGVRGAVAQTADHAYHALGPDQQRVARRILLRMTALGDGTEDSRRRVSRTEFDADPDTTAVLDRLVRARLLTLGDNTVEIAHEALIRSWPTLRGWIDEDRELLLAQRRLTDAAAEWERSGRDEEYLYQRVRLTAWEDRDLGRLNDSERAFLDTSRRRHAHELASTRRRLRRTLIGAGIVVVVVSLLSVLAFVSADRASRERDLAFSGQLVANARAQLALDPELALLLARQAYRVAPTAAAEAALRQASLDSRVLATVPAGQREVYSVVFSPDQRHVASAGTDGTVRVWERAGTDVKRSDPLVLTGQQREAAKLAFTPDGHRLASVGEEGVIRIRDLANGSEVLLRGHQGPVRDLVFDAGGKQLASAGDDGTVRIWDAQTGDEIAVLRGHQGAVWSLAFGVDGRLVSGGEDGTVRVWNLAQGREDAVITAHDGTVKRLAFSQDGRLATAGDDGTIKVWPDLSQHDPLVLRGHDGTVETLAFSPDGRNVATGGQDGVIRVWSTVSSVDPLTLRGHRGVVWDLAYDPDVPSRLASAGSDGTIRFWNVTPPGDPIVLRGHTGRVAAVEFSGDGRHVATGGRDGTVRVWKSAGDTNPVVLRGHTGEVWDVTFSPDGRRVASAGQDGTVRVWNATGDEDPIVLRGHQGDVWDVAFSPDGRHLTSAGNDGTVRIWTTNPDDVPTILRGHEGPVYNVSYSPDGTQLSSAGVDGTVRIWRTAGGDPIILGGHQGGARAATFSPDGKRLATASADGSVRIWRSVSDQDPIVLNGHQGPVAGVVFSSDGQHLATNGTDRTVRIWKTDGSGDSVVIDGFGSSVSNLAFSPDGKALITAHGDGTARIARCEPCVPVEEALTTAENRITRDFTPQERKVYLGQS